MTCLRTLKNWVVALVAVTAGCASVERNTVTQVSTIDALLASVYDGQMSCGQLLEYGDFGIGTFDKLDGEMIVLDGEVFQAKASGKVLPVSAQMTTPFASVVHFKEDQSEQVQQPADYAGIQEIIDRAAPNQNLFYAVRIDGQFNRMKVRAVPGQKKPYPPLAEVTKDQPEFEYENISGTIVGFRSPAYVKGINVPGYHLHFVSADRTKGGHILECTLESGSLQLDQCNRFYMVLPDDLEAFEQVDLSTDRSKELIEVER